MIALLAAMLFASPARAQTVRVDAGAGAFSGIPRVTPLAAPLSVPAPSLSATPSLSAPSLSATPSLPAASAPSFLPAAPAAAAVAAAVPGSPSLPVSGFQNESTTVEPTGLVARLQRGLKRLLAAAIPPLLDSLYDDDSRAHYYHGLSLGTLETAIDNGGALKAGVTFVSDEAGHPYGYARTSSRRTNTPGAVLQFDPRLVAPLIVPGHYNPRAPQPGEKWADVPHWFRAEKDIPLTAQTELSKSTVLNWLAERRDANPEDASWPEKISKFEAAFGAKAPAPKPQDPLGLDGLSFKGGKWRKDGRILTRLGRGSIGFVDVHPARPGLVVKTIDPTLDQLLGGLTVEEAIKHDEHSAAVLADAGIGPRMLGGRTIDGRRVTVRERIFGKTMRELITDHAFGAEEEALVLDMVSRMAEKNILVSDLKPENIMLGTTERDGVRRAWFVDGGVVEAFAPGLDPAARAQKLLDYPNVIGMRMDYNTRSVIETVRTLRYFIAQGREESALSPWRLFLKRLVSSIFMSGLAAANK